MKLMSSTMMSVTLIKIVNTPLDTSAALHLVIFN